MKTEKVYELILWYFYDKNGNEVEGELHDRTESEAVEIIKGFGYEEPKAKWYQFWIKECSVLRLEKYS